MVGKTGGVVGEAGVVVDEAGAVVGEASEVVDVTPAHPYLMMKSRRAAADPSLAILSHA